MEATVTGISRSGIEMIAKFETGKNFGYKMTQKDLAGYDNGDAGGKKTYGYGLLYHPNGKAFMQDIKSVWTQKELEDLYIQSVNKKARKVLEWADDNGISLGQNQLDAMVSAVFNFGNKFFNKSICKIIANDPNDTEIPGLWSHLSDAQAAKGYRGLKDRRKFEAAVYARDIPDFN